MKSILLLILLTLSISVQGKNEYERLNIKVDSAKTELTINNKVYTGNISEIDESTKTLVFRSIHCVTVEDTHIVLFNGVQSLVDSDWKIIIKNTNN